MPAATENLKSTEADHRAPTATRPVLSVIVPVYNSAAMLRRCLRALSESTYENYEALIVDDGSTEEIAPLVSPYGFRYLRIPGPGGPARARNRGAASAQGEYLVFIDADVCVHPDTLALFAASFAADPTVGAVVGSYDDAPAEPNFLSQYKNLFHHYVHQQCDGELSTFWSGCGAMRRELFLQLGGFDEQRYRRPAIEDIELGTWLSAAGHRIVLNRRIEAKHLKRWTWWNLLKTDVFDRGVPWTRLMLRAGKVANTLNVKPTQRISVALAYVTVLAVVGAIWQPLWWLVVAGLVLAVTWLNLSFYRFFFANSGLWFTLRVVPLHWLYFWYCGFSVLCGTLWHLLERARTGPVSAGPLRPDLPA